MRCIRSSLTLLFVTCLLAFLPSLAMADVQVVESNAGDYAVGLVLPDDTVFTLKTGERVKIRILPGNETRVFQGAGRHSLSEPENVQDPTKHFMIAKDGVTIFSSPEEFVARITAQRGALAAFKDHAFVFVHGFNVTFEGALFRTAQIGYDLGMKVNDVHVQFGIPFAFSWPSKGSLAAYGADEDSARISVARLKPFLELVVKNSGAKNVHVIAHSMGNQIVLRTLEALARERPDVRFSQIVLAAPDVDRDEFEQIAKSVSAAADGVTLYASSTDVALNVSKRFRAGQMRAGDVGSKGPTIVRGVDSIDISAASTDIFALNHDVYVSGAVLANDMGLLLGKGLRPPNERTPVFQQRVMEGERYCYTRDERRWD